MEHRMETPRSNGNRRLLGFILIGVGLLFLLVQMAFLAVAVVPRPPDIGARAMRELAPGAPIAPVRIEPGVDRQMEHAEAEMERHMELAEVEMERQMAHAEAEMERAMAEMERDMAHAEIRMERARPRGFLFAPFFGGLNLLGGLLKGLVMLATFAMLGLGALFIVREVSRNRSRPVSTPPATGPEADRAQE